LKVIHSEAVDHIHRLIKEFDGHFFDFENHTSVMTFTSNSLRLLVEDLLENEDIQELFLELMR